jgi:hypothetical protein
MRHLHIVTIILPMILILCWGPKATGATKAANGTKAQGAMAWSTEDRSSTQTRDATAQSTEVQATDPQSAAVLALENRVHEIAGSTTLWPGFDPLTVPLAVYDGTHTYLFRHPNPPAEFTPQDGMFVYVGRHPAVVANTSAAIRGVPTATVMLEGPITKDELDNTAAVVMHESFHVFQGTTGRHWGADESQLFLYPVDDADLLALRRLETEALRRAFEAPDNAGAACWAEKALELRRERFARMDSSFAAYERGIETMEGTAFYVESRAAGRSAPEFPPDGFAAETVRKRAYVTGLAWALLLDRFQPGWQNGFASRDGRFLDGDLESALAGADWPTGCPFSTADRTAAQDRARGDVNELRETRAALEEHIATEPGWRLVIEADPKAPLWPQGFDPMNIRRLDSGLLHTRFLKLGNATGLFEVMGDTVLTEGVGPHPLLNGVRRVVMAGLDSEPAVTEAAGTLTISYPTVKAMFRNAVLERSGKRITIRLGAR